MSDDKPTNRANPISKWAIRAGAVGLFGGVLMGLSKGGGVAFAIGMVLPIGLFAAALGAILGLIIKLVAK